LFWLLWLLLLLWRLWRLWRRAAPPCRARRKRRRSEPILGGPSPPSQRLWSGPHTGSAARTVAASIAAASPYTSTSGSGYRSRARPRSRSVRLSPCRCGSWCPAICSSFGSAHGTSITSGSTWVAGDSSTPRARARSCPMAFCAEASFAGISCGRGASGKDRAAGGPPKHILPRSSHPLAAPRQPRCIAPPSHRPAATGSSTVKRSFSCREERNVQPADQTVVQKEYRIMASPIDTARAVLHHAGIELGEETEA